MLRDLLIGASGGLGLAVFWLIVVFVLAHVTDKDRWRSKYRRFWATDFWEVFKYLCVFMAVVVTVILGIVGGYRIGNNWGAILGGAAAYLTPFVGYGIYVQRKTGFAAWIDSHMQGERGKPRARREG